MASDDANSIIGQYQYLWGKQGNFRSLWNVAAQFCMPAWDSFIGEFADGVNRNTRIFDSTAVIANERFAACMEAMLTPRAQVWEKSKPDDEELDDVPSVAKYMDTVTKIRFAARTAITACTSMRCSGIPCATARSRSPNSCGR